MDSQRFDGLAKRFASTLSRRRLLGAAFGAAPAVAHAPAARIGEICVSFIGCTTGTCCNFTCVDTNSDARNCGRCGSACTPGALCSNGRCVCSGTTPDTCDRETCTNLLVNWSNCGQCNVRCPFGSYCSGGQCIQAAQASRCDSTIGCSTVANGTSSCDNGVCLLYCNAGFRPQDGQCVSASIAPTPIPQPGPDSGGGCNPPCTGGNACCNGICVSTYDNPQHCGTCNLSCMGRECCGYFCCPPGRKCHFGRCVDTDSDSSNCGSPGHSCRSDQECRSGYCECSFGKDCYGECVNTSSDNRNCGFCGNSCGYDESCSGGFCS